MRYHVWLNGQNLPVQEARVSRHPFNQVWQGKQRPVNQTEIAYFVTFDFSGTAKLEIEVDDATVTTVEIRPFEYELQPVRHGQRLAVDITRPGQFVVEVNGRQASFACVRQFATALPAYEKTRSISAPANIIRGVIIATSRADGLYR